MYDNNDNSVHSRLNNFISINIKNAVMIVGTTLQLTYKVYLGNNIDKNIIWKSSDETIATVSNDGVVVAKSQGDAIITVMSIDAKKEDSCNIMVKGIANVIGVNLNTNFLKLNVSGISQLITTMNPSDATNQSVTWTSSDDTIATVSDRGLVTGITSGSAIITIISEDGNKTATCSVTVIDNSTDSSNSYKVSEGETISSFIAKANNSGQTATLYVDQELNIISRTDISADVSLVFEGRNEAMITCGTKLKGITTTTLNGKTIYTCSIPNTGFSYSTSYNQSGEHWSSVSNLVIAPFITINGEQQWLAGYPKRDIYTTAVSTKGIASGNGFTFHVNPILFNSITDWSNAMVDIFAGTTYFNYVIPIDSYSNGTIKVRYKTEDFDWGVTYVGGLIYKVLNVKELLTDDGEYYIDYSANKLYFIPPSGVDVNNADIRLVYRNLSAGALYINDTSKDSNGYFNGKDITFKNLEFNGFIDDIFYNNVSNFKFDNCTFKNCRSCGIKGWYPKNVSVTKCTFKNINSYNIKLDNNDENMSTSIQGRLGLVSGNNILEENTFNSVGYIQQTAAYKCFTSIVTVGSLVQNNSYTHSVGLAIWFGENNNIINNNTFNDCCYVASDSGVIYSGRDWCGSGNLIQNNIIIAGTFNVPATTWSRVGIYLDDCVSGNIAENNSITGYDVGFLYGGGLYSAIINNTISNCINGIMCGIWSNPSEMWNCISRVKSVYKGILWLSQYPWMRVLPSNESQCAEVVNNPEGNKIYGNVFKACINNINITDSSFTYSTKP